MNPILKIISLEWTIQEDFKDWICALAKQLCNKKDTGDSENILYKIIQTWQNPAEKDTGDSENILYKYNSNLAESCWEENRRLWEHIV